MQMNRQQRRILKRAIEKSKRKDVFLFLPDTDLHPFYLRLTLTKKPSKILSVSESEVFFSKYGVARFCNEKGIFLEIWMGSRRVRVGTKEVIDTFIRDYYERQGVEVPSDLTTEQLILAYATSAFAKCYQIKIDTDGVSSGKEHKTG